MIEHKSISIADQIFEKLEHDILAGKYARGEVLSEMRLSTELGVSRTPIREAIRRLEQENILEDGSRGAVVVGITREDTLDMYEIRLRIEEPAAQRAARNISDEALQEMRKILDLQRFYAEKPREGSSDEIKNLDSRFHEILYTSCGSSAFRDVLLMMHRKITKFRMASVSKQSRALKSVEEHETIYEALAAHDPEAAGKAALEHARHAKERISEIEV